MKPAPSPTCPTCKKPASPVGNKCFPFCTERCQLVDLGRWLDEDYRVPGEPDAEALEALEALAATGEIEEK